MFVLSYPYFPEIAMFFSTCVHLSALSIYNSFLLSCDSSLFLEWRNIAVWSSHIAFHGLYVLQNIKGGCIYMAVTIVNN